MGLAIAFHSCCQNGLVFCGVQQGLSVPASLHLWLYTYSLALPGSFHAPNLAKDSWFSAFQVFIFFLLPWVKLAEEPCVLGTWMLNLLFLYPGENFSFIIWIPPQSSLGDLRPSYLLLFTLLVISQRIKYKMAYIEHYLLGNSISENIPGTVLVPTSSSVQGELCYFVP